MATSKAPSALKVFNLYRCWKHNRGRYLVAAKSLSEAAKLIGCSNYFLREYHYELTREDCPMYKLAMSAPKQVFKQQTNKEPYLPISE